MSIGRHRVRAFDLHGDQSLDALFAEQRKRVRDYLSHRMRHRERKVQRVKQHANGRWYLTWKQMPETKQLALEQAPKKSQEMVADED